MRISRYLAVGAVPLLAVGAVAAFDGGERSDAPRAVGRRAMASDIGTAGSPRPARPTAGGTYAWGGVNSLANFAHAAFTGRVTAVSGPKPFSKASMYDQYTEVTVDIDEVVFDSPELRLTAGMTLPIYSLGSGRAEGDEMRTASGKVLFEQQVDGPWMVGERVLLLVRDVGYRDDGPSGQVVNGYQGHFTVQPDGQATSYDPEWRGELHRLIAKLRHERSLGRVAGRSQCTQRDPFGDEKPGCSRS